MVDFHKRILFSDEAHFWLNGYVNKQNCRIWREANPQVYVETPLNTRKTDCLVRFMGWWNPSSKTMKATTLQSMVIDDVLRLWRKVFIFHLFADVQQQARYAAHEGRSVTSVAAEFGIAHSIVSRHWRQFQTTGTAIRGFCSGRPRGTTPADDRYIVLQARRNRRQIAGEIARHMTQVTGRPIWRFTVARRLHGGGLFARRPVRCVPLTPAHRKRRSLWCREHRNWRDNEWGRVLFTDESRFSLSSDSHRILIWRERGSRNHPSNIIERDRYGGRGVLVWGDITLGSRTDLHIFDACSVNGTRYCNEILLPYVRLFRGAMGLQFLFMDDNAPYHRTVAAEQLLESEDIERMDWPSGSPDLNPIEHVWNFLGRRLAARTLPTVTIRELRLALQDEWAAMPLQLIDTLILRMGRRCETCLAVRGDHMPY
ncbi:transposable element Tcb2 transposase [Trichonephila clavipes]|nr:transposable element Tcb2 transposase [Trichonephila clavipes]